MKNLIICLGLLFFTGSVCAQKIGLQLYSLRNEFKEDVEATFALIQQMGIKYVEGGDGSGYGLSNDDYKDILEKYDLTLMGLGADFNELENDVDAVIERAKSFNVKYVICYWIPHDGDKFGIDETKRAVAVFEDAAVKMKAAGITFCYHPHGYEFRPYGSGDLFDYLVAETKELKFEMDVYWVKQGGVDPLTLLKKYQDRFVLFHMKDRTKGTIGNKNGQGDVETNVVLGTGDVGIAQLQREAVKMGVDYVIIEDESSRSVTQIPKSVNFLKSIK